MQALPTVAVVKDGQPIDGFANEQTDEFIVEFVDKYLPKQWQLQHQQAQELMQQGQFTQALQLLQAAFEPSEQDVAIKEDLIACQLELNELDQAKQLLDSIEFVQQSERYQQLLATYELKQQAGQNPELLQLESAYQSSPDDRSLQLQLAVAYSQVGKYQER